MSKQRIISKTDRTKRLVACVGISGFFLACLLAVLNYRQYLQAWQVKFLGSILVVAIITTLAYGSVWVWIYNYFTAGGKKKKS